MEKLTATEYKYMCIIWEHPEGILNSEIYKLFPQTMGSKSTILHRIVQKGYARWVQKGRQVEYYPVIPKKEYEQFLINQELKKKMGISSIHALFAAFCGKEYLTEDEKEKLERLIDEIGDE